MWKCKYCRKGYIKPDGTYFHEVIWKCEKCGARYTRKERLD